MSRPARLCTMLQIVLASLSLFCQSAPRQQTVQRDPQAIAILTNVLSTAGGVSALTSISDYKGSGNITFNWADDPVQGSVTVEAVGTSTFRMDATLPDGVHTWMISGARGFLKTPDGTVASIPGTAPVGLGTLTFPYPHVVSASIDSTTSIVYVGLESPSQGVQVQHIRLQRTSSPVGVPGSVVTVRDIFVDPTSFVIVSTQDQAYLTNNNGCTPSSGAPSPSTSTGITPCTGGPSHAVQFSNYQQVNGVLVPFSITEVVGGQQTLTIQLDQILFNQNPSSTDFQP